jgi:hypothetical protein
MAAQGGGLQQRRRGMPPARAAAAADAGARRDLSRIVLSAQQRREQHPLLEGINDATKWAVSCAALATLLWRRDLVSAWCILGSVVAAANCRVRFWCTASACLALAGSSLSQAAGQHAY